MNPDPLLSADREREDALDALLNALHADARVCGHDALNIVVELGKRGYRIVSSQPAPDALRAAADEALARLSENDVMYDSPVAMSGEPMDPVLFVNFAALRAALAATPPAAVPQDGLDVAVLAEAIQRHRAASHWRGDLDGDDPLGHCDAYVFDNEPNCHDEIAAEYDRLALLQPGEPTP